MPGGELAQMYVRIRPDFTGFKQQAESESKSAFAGVGKIVTGALAGIAVGGLFKTAFGELAEGQKVAAQTTVALQTTGEAAHVTAGQVDELANSILKKTGIDDEATKASENLLLTFTNIRNEVGAGNDIFNQATVAIGDLATRMGGGAVPTAEALQGATVQLGKALNDPIKGITALTRVGVSFDAQQKETIKQLVATGHSMDAQKLILAELHKEFGGSAEAAGATLPGQLTILRESFRNLLAEGLQPLLPAFLDLAHWAIDVLPGAFHALGEAFSAIRDEVLAWAGILGPVFQPILDLATGLKDAFGEGGVGGVFARLRENFENLSGSGKIIVGVFGGIAAAIAAMVIAANPVTATILTIAGLAEAFKLAYERSETFRRIVDGLVATVQANLPAVEAAFRRVFDDIRQIVETTITVVRAIWDRFGGDITRIAETYLRTVATLVKTYFGIVVDTFRLITDLIHGDWSKAWDDLQNIVRGALRLVETSVKGFATILYTAASALGGAILDGIQAGLAALGALLLRLVRAGAEQIAGAATNFRNAALGLVDRFLDGYVNLGTRLWATVHGALNSLWENIKGWAGTLYAVGTTLGKELVQGIYDGTVGKVVGTAKDAAHAVGGAFKSAFNSVFGSSPYEAGGLWVGIPFVEGIGDGMLKEAGRATGKIAGALGGIVKSFSDTLVKGAAAQAAADALNQGSTLYQAGVSMATPFASGIASGADAVVSGVKSLTGSAIDTIRKLAPQFGIDANAAIAVAMHESGASFGRVGDSGHAFGPFQLNNAGGVVTGRSAADANAFANSLDGVAFALRKMGEAGAAGKTGFDAIHAIVYGFERPANKAAELEDALRNYAKLTGGAVPTVTNALQETGATMGAAVTQGIADGIKGKGKGAKSTATNPAWDAITDLISNLQDPASQISPLLANSVAPWYSAAASTVSAVQDQNQKLADILDKAREAARAKIDGIRTQFQTSWTAVAAGADQAFQARTAQMEAALNARYDAIIQGIQTKLTAGIQASQQAAAAAVAEAQTKLGAQQDLIEANRAAPTKSERLLTELQNQRATDARQKALDDARAALAVERATSLVEGGPGQADAVVSARDTLAKATDPDAIAKAQKDLDDALDAERKRHNDALLKDEQAVADAKFQIKVADLTRVAAAERKRKDDDAADASARAAEAERQRELKIQEDAKKEQDRLTKEAAAKTKRVQAEQAQAAKDLQARRDLEQRHLDAELAALEENLGKQGSAHANSQEKILALLDKYGIRYEQSGQALGNAFARGIEESVGAAEASAQKLAAAVAKYLPHSPADEGPLSRLPDWNSYLLAGLDGVSAGRSLSDALDLGRAWGGLPGGARGLGDAVAAPVAGLTALTERLEGERAARDEAILAELRRQSEIMERNGANGVTGVAVVASQPGLRR